MLLMVTGSLIFWTAESSPKFFRRILYPANLQPLVIISDGKINIIKADNFLIHHELSVILSAAGMRRVKPIKVVL